MKHTKGPWALIDVKKLLGKAHCQDYNFQVSREGLWICNISNHINKHKANAKLIAKAPEMYEALKGIYRLRNIILPPAEDVKLEHQEEVTAIYQAIKKIESIIKELDNE